MIIEIMFVWKSQPKYDNYIECTNDMATVNGCDRILKADAILFPVYINILGLCLGWKGQ